MQGSAVSPVLVAAQSRWKIVRESLSHPYRPPWTLFLLVAIVPIYIFIPVFVVDLPGYKLHFPEIALDRMIPVVPVWALIYGALYAFLIILPMLVVREPEHMRRAIHAYLSIWLAAYVVFILYPTGAPRPPAIHGTGFASAGLRLLYDSDPPFNCFPSLHVAHSFVSAFALNRVQRRLGIVSFVTATLIALSTLFTKQHWVLDVVAGVLLATAAWAIFLRRAPADKIPLSDRQAAPIFAMLLAPALLVAVAAYWILFLLRVFQ